MAIRLRTPCGRVGALLAGCLLLAACTAGHARPGATRLAALHPTHPSGVTNCGSWEISATTISGSVGLLSCASLAGMTQPVTVHIARQGAVLISGLPATSSLSVTPAGLLRLDGSTLTGLRPGEAVVTVHNWFCVSTAAGAQPTSCTLARVVVS